MMKMRVRIILIFLVITGLTHVESQNKVLRINYLNPGIDFEVPLSKDILVSVNPGIGYGISYPELNPCVQNGFTGMISPFVNVYARHLYNLRKRESKGLNTSFNSGNFLGIRTLVRGKAIQEFNLSLLFRWFR